MIPLPDLLVVEAGFPKLARNVVRPVGLATVDAVGCMWTGCLRVGSDGWLGFRICFATICELPVVFSAMRFTAVGTKNTTEGTGLHIRAMTEPPTALAEGEASDLLHRHNVKVVMTIHKCFLGEVLR